MDKETESYCMKEMVLRDISTLINRYKRVLEQHHHSAAKRRKLNFRIGGHKPPDLTPWIRGVLNQGVMSGGLRPPILNYSFQNPLSCNRKTTSHIVF